MNCYKCATPIPDNSRFCLSCGADVSGEMDVSSRKTIAVEQDPDLMVKLQADVGTEYVIERELGRGGMAIVYLGHDAALGRKVAVKLLPPELTYSAGAGVIERFKREARTSATLDHPNIIPVYRVSQGQKLFWYVMKFLEGQGLDHVLRHESQLPVDRAAHIIRQTADALDYAHKHKVIHRDIKPANIMLDEQDRVTVTDFGIAKALDANTLTATGSMIGTPYYMSPEQCSGKRVGPASDQYSLGVMAYQMLGGHLPFTGDSLIDIVRQHCMDPVPPLGVLRPALPAVLVQVVERALAKAPEQRFASCMEFAKAFEAASRGLDVTAAPAGKAAPQRLSATKLVSPVPGAIRTARGQVQRGGRRALLVGAGLVVIAGAAAAVVLKPWELLRQQPTVAPPTADTGLVLAAGPPAQPATDSARDTTAALPPAATPAAPPAAPATSRVRVSLLGLPRGAIVTRDSRPATATMNLEPGSYRLRIVVAGFQPWDSTVQVRAGRPLSLRPRFTAIVAQAAQRPTAPAEAPVQQQAVATPQPAAPQPAPSGAAPSAAAPATAMLSVGSRPATASMTINGRAMTANPVTNYPVPAGSVRIQFRWTNSAGAPMDTVIVLDAAAGATVRRNVTLRMTP